MVRPVNIRTFLLALALSLAVAAPTFADSPETVGKVVSQTHTSRAETSGEAEAGHDAKPALGTMDVLRKEFGAGFPNLEQSVRLLVRISMAMLMGAIIGLQRERTGKPAGLRTHMLVAMGAAMFVIGAIESGMSSDGISRVIQGLTAGIGFIGAGAILKQADKGEIQGLTTAAGIWATAAVGVAVGLGLLGLAVLSVILIWFVLASLGILERRLKPSDSEDTQSR
jgi:putative Mg2+ transporter-C (MgtC) family protein